MAIYRGAGGAGDAVNDSSSEASAAVIAQAAAEAAAVAAEAAKVAAQLAETNAEAAETNAETAETNAETAASNALTSANNASNSAVSAASSASAASSSASSASTSATNAANSSTTAAGSASAAAISATAASNSASSASGYATTASNAATSASASAASATASEANALTSKNAAATSATNAASSASTANSAATTATTQAGIATTQATNASNSASAAATSATNASNSASAAATSASNAATSATSAQSAQAAAESARDATLTAYDNFDDRYLGSKTADPSVDNDGNALVAGTLYFNSVDGVMKLWTGSIWTAAYVSGAGVLLQANNLSDLNNAASARTNLGLGTAATTAATDYATAAQGAKADTALQPAAIGVTVQGYDADLAAFALKTAPTGAVVGTTDTQTLTNKTLTDPTVNGNIATTGINFDSNTLVIDATNNRVGVGTASPSDFLEVMGNGSTGIRVSRAAATTQYLTISSGSNASTFDASSAVGAMSFGIAGTEAMRINSSGYVLIGTTAASSYKQTIYGAAGTVYQNAATGTGSNGLFIGNGDSTVAYIWNYENDSMLFGTQATERMRIDSSGNVGIGTNSPIYPLQVGSYTGSTTTVLAVGSTTEGRLSFGDGTSGVDANAGGLRYFHSSDAMALYTAATERMRIDSSGNLGLGVTPSAWAGTAGKALQINNLTIGQNIGFDVSVLTTNGYATSGTAYNYIGTAAAAQYRLGSGGHIWYTAPSGTAGTAITFTQAMTLNSSGRLFLGSTTGVGNEQFNVTFNSSGSITQAINTKDSNASASGNYHIVLRKSDDTYLGGLGRSSTNNAMFVDGNSYLDLRTGGTERMRIDASGNVGLGTTTPNTKVHAYGSSGNTYIQAQRAAQSTGEVGIQLSGGTSGTDWYMYQPASSNNLYWYGNSSTRMVLDSSGNLLVGTASNITGLSASPRQIIYGSTIADGSGTYPATLSIIDDRAYNSTSPSPGGGIVFGYKYTTGGAIALGSSIQGFKENSTDGNYASGLRFLTRPQASNPVEAMRIDSSGILSVGTTATVADANVPVQLNAASGAQKFFGVNRGGSYGLLLGYDYSNDIARIRNIANTAMTFETNNVERMRIDSSGNVGIGTSSPAGKLDVSGAKDTTILTISAPLSTVGGGAFANYSELLFKNTGGANSDASIRSYGNVWNTAGSQLAFFTSNNSAVTERMRLDSSGNLGLGVTPSDTIGYGRTLDMGAASGAVIYLRDTDAPTSQYGLIAYDGNDNGLKISNQNSGGYVRFSTAATERMRIDSSGNVGIGISSPNGRLNVVDSSANAVQIRVDNTSQTAQYLSINMMGATAFGVSDWVNSAVIEAVANGGQSGTKSLYFSAYNGPIIFATNARTERFRIGTAGQLGIGGANYGTSGQVLTSNGSGAAPSWADAGGAVKAWVNFNGTNGSIRASSNVSSVTRNSAGNYTINLSTAMSDTNYSCVSDTNNGTSTGTSTNMRSSSTRPLTTSTIGMYTFPNDASGTINDSDINGFALFR